MSKNSVQFALMYTFIIFLLLGCNAKEEKTNNAVSELTISLDTINQKDENNHQLEVTITNNTDYDIFLPGYAATHANLYLRLVIPDTDYVEIGNYLFHQQIKRDTATNYNRYNKNIQKLSDSLKAQIILNQTLSENDFRLIERRTFFACTQIFFLKKRSSYKTSYKLDFLNEIDSLAKVKFPKSKPKYEIFFVYNPEGERLKDILHIETSVDFPNEIGSHKKMNHPVLSDTLTLIFNK